ncbi:MAG: adenylate/guanylate cyclase [Ignavibacteria bacterium]|nr:adenylate/guanylate cyclase [Ignavibacteria bacterium]
MFNNSFLSYSQFQLIFFDLIFVFSILFLKNFLNAGLYFKKWNKYYNYSIYYGLFLFIFIPFNIQRDSNFSYIWGISFSILYPLFALSITSMIIIAYKLLKNRLQKSAVFVLIGWLPIFFITILVPIIITFYEKFFMVGFNETLAVFFRYGIVTIFLFEMYVFFFGISYQSRLNKKELEKKKIENQRLEFEKEFELKEKELTEKLLLNVLPESIASRLKSGETTIADLFNEASVIFIDIANFTKYSSRTNPEELVKELNRIYTIFDGISTKHGVEKIKTIGDCYMAAAGIPLPKENHAEAIALMAFEILETMNGYKTADGTEIKFRIGIDSGQIVAGIIGEQKFIYDLWGDTVNTASRMEEYGEIGKIQCTQEFKDLFTIQSKSDESSKIIDYYFEKRGEIEIKGKGMMTTWFLKTYIE